MAVKSSTPKRPPAPRKLRATGKKAPTTERQHIAKQLHNSVCQTISGVRFLTSAMARTVPVECIALARNFEDLERQLAQASSELHQLIKLLRTG
jgi:signal transduction histidine kinase